MTDPRPEARFSDHAKSCVSRGGYACDCKPRRQDDEQVTAWRCSMCGDTEPGDEMPTRDCTGPADSNGNCGTWEAMESGHPYPRHDPACAKTGDPFNDDGCTCGLDDLHDDAFAEGEAAGERAATERIVEWLRAQANGSDLAQGVGRRFAIRIERGEHREGT